ncbi:MAG: FAD-binding oxidoreductase [Spirochaetota bacterium]
METDLQEKLTNLLGREKVFLKKDARFAEEEFLSYGIDRTKLYQANFQVLLFPESTEDVAKILSFAYQHDLAIVPSGGRTGYAGGAVAHQDEIVVSLAKMDAVLKFDALLGAITVQGGMITQNLHQEVEDKGFYFPVDFAATGSSHIAGNLATNAGGVRVVRFGPIRNWVLGMKVVTGTGEVLSFNGEILKNNTGYDLKQLFIGSEGTLGIITEVTLKLTQKPKDSRVLFLALPDYAKILQVFQETHAFPLPVLTYEFLSEVCIQKVCHHLGVTHPFAAASPYYVLLEFEITHDSDEDELFRFLESITEKEMIEDGSIAQNSTQAEVFWKYREGISESLSLLHTVHKNDISLPLANMEAFITAMQALLQEKYPDFSFALFGHIGDGNLHLNILKPSDMLDEDFFATCKKVDPDMFQLIQKYDGSISAEHGIGLLKKDFLGFSREKVEIQIMKEIKRAFDPKNILNPGKIFD